MRNKGVFGYLTIYVSLSLTVMLSLCLTLIGGAVRSSVRLEAECVADIGLNSILAEYHREVFKQYNLLLLDTSYGTAYPSYYNTEARLKYYLEQNGSEEACTYFSFLYKDMLELEVTDAFLKEAALVTDGNGVLFQKRASEAILEDAGVGFAKQVLEWISVVKDNGWLENNLEAELKKTGEEIDSYVDKSHMLSEERWISTDIVNPVEHIQKMQAQGILKWVLEESDFVSDRSLDLSGSVSSRRSQGAINRGNAAVPEEGSILERILCGSICFAIAGITDRRRKRACSDIK